MISGTYDRVKRKNSARFDMDVFKKELREARRDFFLETERMNRWLNKQMPLSDVKELIESIVKSDRKAEKMTSLYFTEAATRGHNVFSLYSAFTNYATYADERNGFASRTQATTHSRSRCGSVSRKLTSGLAPTAFRGCCKLRSSLLN